MDDRVRFSAALGALCFYAAPALADDHANVDVYDLSVEQLLNVEVTSVSRRAEPVSQASASVEVITSDQIRRSGAQNIPEILRMARNLEVAQIDAQRYAISARGFNTYESSNKLLVLIDGRSVYTPLYSGVFWDQLHVAPQDIERIEVISGPGGTLWGANAVNGVINIITKNSADTQGISEDLFGGDVDQRLDVRYGGAFGNTGHFRIFASGVSLGETQTMTDQSAGDGGNGVQGGFRADWGGQGQQFMLQGEMYQDEIDIGGERRGHNVLGSWHRDLGAGSSFEVQAYYSNEQRDAALRASPGIFDSLETYDISFQHNIALGQTHQIVWGGGYRSVNSEFTNETTIAGFLQPHRILQYSNAFIQDEIALRRDLSLTLGVKLEDDAFTGLEYMPNVRLAWRPRNDFMVWGAVSRAVRTPSRIDEELQIPGFSVPGGFVSEDLLAYELGVRAQPLPNATLSATFYWHDYDNLRSATLSPPAPGGLPLRVGNGVQGEVHGLELAGDLAINPHWRIGAGLTLLDESFTVDPLSLNVNASGDDPRYQIFLRSQSNLTDKLTLDLDLRSIDRVNPQVPGYTDLDARVGWRLTDHAELAFAGRNLLDDAHPESFDVAPLLQVRRSFEISLHLTY